MRRHALIGRFFAALAVALLLASGAIAQTRGRSFLWKVQSGANVMYLAGSVHALTAEADPLSGGLGLLSQGMYQDGRTFSRAVSRDTVAMVERKLQNTPLAIDLI